MAAVVPKPKSKRATTPPAPLLYPRRKDKESTQYSIQRVDTMVHFRNILPVVQKTKRRTSGLPCNDNDSEKSSTTPKQQQPSRSFLCRKNSLFLTLPLLWIFYKTTLQSPQALRRRVEKPSGGLSSSSPSTKTATRKDSTGILGIADLADISPVKDIYTNHTLAHATWEEAVQDRQAIVQHLHEAGVHFDLSVLKLVPTADEVHALYGDQPVILGMERCAAFRAAYKPAERFVGIAGQHNVGTNAMVRYLRQNVAIPGNPREGFLPQVPWHKHGWEPLRHKYNFSFPANHDSVLPVVIVRDPYFWMHSMCESPYLMYWEHGETHCPNLVQSNGQGNPAKTQWGTFLRRWDSLAHVWSEFYREYEQVDYPRLMIRFEGELVCTFIYIYRVRMLQPAPYGTPQCHARFISFVPTNSAIFLVVDVLFHTEEVIDKIRECAGAKWKHNEFIHAPSAVKKNKYFSK